MVQTRSRRTMIAAAFSIASGVGLYPARDRRSEAQEVETSAVTLGGQLLAWQSPWSLDRHVIQEDADSIILVAGDATFAFVSQHIERLDPGWNTPGLYRDMLIRDLDEQDRELVTTVDDATGAHAVTLDPETEVVYLYALSQPVPDYLVQNGLYAPLSSFADVWSQTMDAISVDGAPVFQGFDESLIVAPVVAMAGSVPPHATPIANDMERQYLIAAWDLFAMLDESSTRASLNVKSNDPFGDTILTVLEADIEIWSGAQAAAESLVPPHTGFEPLHRSLVKSATAFTDAAGVFGALAGSRDVARSANWSEFTQAWDDADDLLREVESELQRWDAPGR